MVYPTGTPVQETILDHVKTTLAAIASPTYHTTVIEVTRLRGDNLFEMPQRPCVVISVPDVEDTDTTLAMIAKEMRFTCRCALDDRTDAQEAVGWFIQDIRHALTRDITRGGVAVDTHVTGSIPFQSDQLSSICGADVLVHIQFRHLYDDPNTPI